MIALSHALRFFGIAKAMGMIPPPPPTEAEMLAHSKSLWLGHRDASTFMNYMLREKDLRQRETAAFQFLFTVGSTLADRKLYTAAMCKEFEFPFARNYTKEAFEIAGTFIPDALLIGGAPTFGCAMLQNIAVYGNQRAVENRGLALQLCVERMSCIQANFPDLIKCDAAEIAVRFLLDEMAEIRSSSASIHIDTAWARMFNVAKVFATYRSLTLLTKVELFNLRNRLVRTAPHYAHEIQREISAMSG